MKIVKKIRKSVVNICKKNQATRTLLRNVRGVKSNLLFKAYKVKHKVEDKTIVFDSFMGRKYSCSPKALYEEMLKDPKYKDYTFIWAFKNIRNKKIEIPQLERAKLVKYNSRRYLSWCSRAKYIITNSRLPDAIKLRKEQKFVQCWHGTPLKRLGYDLETEGGNALNSLSDMRKKYKVDAVRYSYLLSPSKFTTDRLTSAFNLKENNPDVNIIEKGYPRNDFLINYKERDLRIIKRKLGIYKSNKKVILYAPTWRDNQHESGVGYTYDLGVDFDKLKEKLGKDYVILFRPHYFVANSFDFKKYKGFVIDVSEYEEINDLYIAADILITDYSSVFFDYANLKKPMIFYMYDLEDYKDNIRGFYIDLKELPGKIVQKENELIEEIVNVTNKFKYDKKYKAFNDKYTYLDDGKASKRVLEEIMK